MSSIRKFNTKELYELHQHRVSPYAGKTLIPVLHNLRSAHNVGSAFRTADAFGLKKIILSGFTPKAEQAEVAKTALGAQNSVHSEHYDSLETLLEYYPLKEYQYLAMEQTNESQPLHSYAWDHQKPTLLFFGNEVEGLDDHTFSYIHDFIEIEQFGTKHSLNVSVSFGIALYAFMLKSF